MADTKQLVELFNTSQSVISRHLNNIFNSAELDKKSNMQKMHNAFSDKPVTSYSLDAVISVGYRVNSKKATDFRIWATEKLGNYLLSGYILDRKKLSVAYDKFQEIKDTLLLIEEKSKFAELSGQEKNLLDIIGEYAKTFDLLEKYDQGKLEIGRVNKYLKFSLESDDCLRIIESLRQSLVKKKMISDLFGQSAGDKITGVI